MLGEEERPFPAEIESPSSPLCLSSSLKVALSVDNSVTAAKPSCWLVSIGLANGTVKWWADKSIAKEFFCLWWWPRTVGLGRRESIPESEWYWLLWLLTLRSTIIEDSGGIGEPGGVPVTAGMHVSLLVQIWTTRGGGIGVEPNGGVSESVMIIKEEVPEKE